MRDLDRLVLDAPPPAEVAGVRARRRSTWPSCRSRSATQELILVEALGLGPDVKINPSGGPLAGNPVMATGLIRFIEATPPTSSPVGASERVAHATGGPGLQQNLVVRPGGHGS